MGGTALSKPSVRLQRKEFESVRDSVVNQLRSAFSAVTINYIPYYLEKESFGDLDILTNTPLGAPDVASAINAVEFKRNSSVVSYGVTTSSGQFQVDVIYADAVFYDFALNYFSYNDLGNLIGRIAHASCFKFGHKGLAYVVREPDNADHVLDELIVTRNFDEALLFLGYDPVLFHNPETFKTTTDIFEFAGNNPYFSADIFQLHNRNAVSRIRDKKRKTYTDFLLYLTDDSVIKSLPNFDYSEENKTKHREKMLNNSFKLFPSFLHQYRETMEALEKRQLVKQKFNATIVTALTGRTDRDLGILMKTFRSMFRNENELLQLTQDEINALIVNIDQKLLEE